MLRKIMTLTAGLAVLGASAQTSALNIFDHAVFYDGYEGKVVEAETEDGILRHTNYLYARKLTDEMIDKLGGSLRLDAMIHAHCDNYDRLGNITLAFVPKGAESYNVEEVTRIELGRFVTPFMNKRKSPTKVPYVFYANNVSSLLRDRDLRSQYDSWVEFEVFGIPYAAQTQIPGCSGKNDVFGGTLDFVTDDEPAVASAGNLLVPVVMKKTEIFGPVNFNNYREEACDTIGVATKTWNFTVPEDCADARLVLITSNHGAGENGEEYIHRRHLLYVDGDIRLDYTPGGVSCEPYRRYNTQANGIYGSVGNVEENMDFWLNYSNWCPGAVIPTREIHLGALKKGEHEMMLRVPDAEFYGKAGDFYVSAYVHGVRDGMVPSSLAEYRADAGFEFVIEGDIVRFSGDVKAAEVAVYSYDGRLLYGTMRPGGEISMAGYDRGMYIVSVRDAEGKASVLKYVRK